VEVQGNMMDCTHLWHIGIDSHLGVWISGHGDEEWYIFLQVDCAVDETRRAEGV